MFMKQSHLRRYGVTLAVSYMEIYKDEVYDLLVTRENVCHLTPCEGNWIHLFLAIGSETSSARKRPGQSVRRQPLQHTYLLRRRIRRALRVCNNFITMAHISLTDSFGIDVPRNIVRRGPPTSTMLLHDRTPC